MAPTPDPNLNPNLTCPNCGLATPPGGRYCPHCAAPLPALAAAPLPALAAAPLATTPPSPSPARRLSGGAKVLLAALALGVVAAVVVVVLLVLGFHRASTQLTNALTPRPGRPSGYHGPAYAGMLVQDHVASGPDGSIDVNGETLTAGNLQRTGLATAPALCSPVTIINHSPETKDVGALEWKLQQPDGIVQAFGIAAFTDTLQAGQIAPGGQGAGTVCFSDTGQSGSFVLLWQPLGQVGRGVWILHF